MEEKVDPVQFSLWYDVTRPIWAALWTVKKEWSAVLNCGNSENEISQNI